MRHLILALAVPALFVLGSACGGDDGDDDGGQRDGPQPIASDAADAMGALDSYRLDIVFDDHDELATVVEFVAPDTYRVLLPVGQDGSLSGEAVMIGDSVYSRECGQDGCSAWAEEPRPSAPVPPLPSPSYFPDWPLVALEMAADLETAGAEVVDGVEVARLHGSVNHLRAILENERRLHDAAGDTSFDEALQPDEATLNFYDENPSAMDAWISDDGLLRRVTFDIPPDGSGGEQRSFRFEYSRFNDVVIEAPE